jgi:ADP-ribose pyrophosphatase
MRAFLYGTLRDRPLRRIVLGREVATEPALLRNNSVFRVRDGDWPTILARPGGEAAGLLTEPLDAEAAARFGWYEATFGYGAEAVAVEGATARLYRGEETASTEAWSLGEWQSRWADLTRIAAAEVMDLYPGRDPGWVASRWTQFRQRADSAVRARRANTPADLRRAAAAGDVEVAAQRRPYTDYFSLVEQDLRFRLFDGGMSDLVARAAFVAGDAVTVLPYDPAADSVLLVEQFRFGPWARGDLRPWTLEPVAGRIDPGEAAEETARREAREEAGVSIDRLEKVGSYYPTTGALTEYICSFVGLCDLSGQSSTVAGSAFEDEDILSHVVPFGRLIELVETGEVENGPLLISASWLSRNRDRLRASQ